MKYSALIVVCLLLSTLIPHVVTSSKKPSETDPNLWCNVCQALVREMIKKLGSKKREYDVLEAYDGICKIESFPSYNFSPPEMVRACKDFVSEHEDDLVDGMVKRKNNKEVESAICSDATEACIGGVNGGGDL